MKGAAKGPKGTFLNRAIIVPNVSSHEVVRAKRTKRK